MIYVYRNWAIVPQQIKNDLQAAADALDLITDKKKRKAFIKDKKNQAKWAALRGYMLQMSSGKCWYSEARDCVGRLQVDHFRPHGRAKQAEKSFAEGYSWLAFELDNFRLAGQLCNSVNKEYSTKSVGKGEWFPLKDPSKRASLRRRQHRKEVPLLLDPTDQSSAEKLIFNEGGTIDPNPTLDPDSFAEVETAIRCLGLRQSALDRGRGDVWKQCAAAVQRYSMLAIKPDNERTVEEKKIMNDSLLEMINLARGSSPFSAVARCCLIANYLSDLIVRDELACLPHLV